MAAPDTSHDPAMLGLRALAWTLAEPARAHRLLDVTGLTPADLKASAGGPGALFAALGFPRRPGAGFGRMRRGNRRQARGPGRRASRARGMSRPLLICDCDEVLLHMVRHFGT